MDIRKVLENTAKRFPKKPAIIFKGEAISFAQLRETSLRLANVLAANGAQKGDKIAIYLPSCPEYVYSYLACFYLGCVGVPLDFMLKTDELTSCLEHSETKILIASQQNDVSFEQIQKAVPTLQKIILCRGESVSGNVVRYENAIVPTAVDLSEVKINDSDPALIMYTSGTTGKPKGILLNYKHLDGSPEAMKHFVDLTDKDVKLAAIPLSHIGGFIYIQNCVHFGITVVLMERFSPYEFLENITKYRVTCFHIVPAMYTAILTLKQIDKFDLSSLRWVVVFGAPSSPEIMERFHQYCPNAKLLNGWGMTETCPPNTVTPLNSTNIASVGKPAPNCEIKIFDEDNHELHAGETGEIAIRGWIVMEGYYKDPEATAALKRNGWLYTGDLGRFDKEGFLYIVGRKKEMIKAAGQIVCAPEVEAALQKHEAVAEVAVIGVPDSLRGETVKAFVVLRESAKTTPEDLRYFAREHLAHFKVPQSIEIRSTLPKNRTGKIDKELLKSEVLIKQKGKIMTTMRKEVHMTGQDLMNMVQLRPKDVGKYALVPGPKERADAIVKKMKNPVKNFTFMEYTMYTGRYDGIPLTTINGGRFAADTAITTEILCNAQVKAMIRVGSCGALREDIKVGDLVIATTALKGEGVTQYYVDKNFVPTADAQLTRELTEVTQKALKSPLALGRKVHVGCCWTTDVILKETRENVGKAVDQGAIAVDMVTAAFLTICQNYKIPAAVLMAVSDNVITGEMGFLNPGYYMAEGSIVDIALSLIKELELSQKTA